MSSSRTLGPAPAPGATIGRYRVLASLGTGGSATVFRARDEEGGGAVALKVLHPQHVLPDDRRRFTREFETVQRMDHPNVVKVYDAGVHEGYPWIAMEFVDGEPLDALIDRWREDPPHDRMARVERILRGLCAGLQYVHDLGFVHRDIKPSNILVRSSGEPLLTDFGVVKARNAGTQLTQMGQLVGTVAFMAPEQIADQAGVDARADLYGLGAVLYMMLTFRRPIEADSVGAYLARHLVEVPRPPVELDPSVPRALSRVCSRLLMKDPSQRQPSASAVLAALDAADLDEAPPLRGRDEQLGWLSRRLDALGSGEGGVVLLTGVTGSGRSEMLRQALDLADGKGITARTGPTSRGASLFPEPAPPGRHHRPALIALDDLDLADAAAVTDVVSALREHRDAPVMLLAVGQSDAPRLAPLLDGAGLGGRPEILELGPLERRSVVALLRDRGLSGPAVPVLGRRLHGAFRGNPGPILEQLDALVHHGWLEDTAGALRPTVPVSDLASATLPIPDEVGARLNDALDALDPPAVAVAEVLALVGQSTPVSFVEQCRPDLDVDRAAWSLTRVGLAVRLPHGHQERLALAHPAAETLVIGRMADDARRALHLRIARALHARRRREPNPEAARHFLEAGQPEQAYPLLLQAARRAARSGAWDDVIRLCRQAADLREVAEPSLPPERASKMARWLHMLTGEAWLARQAWDDAVVELRQAVDTARADGDHEALARCLSSLGRACYRAGDLVEAAPLLREALDVGPAASPERAAAARALGDILLRAAKLDEAEALWAEALQIAQDQHGRDAEARARRGLAHLRALQQDFAASADLLDQAEDLLEPDGDVRVRASVITRSVELDLAAGRYGTALHRCAQLSELARGQETGGRLPEATALRAEVMWRLGQRTAATTAAGRVGRATGANPAAHATALLRAARVLCDAGHHADARELLDSLPELDGGPEDAPAQVAALRARMPGTDARESARWALARPVPTLILAGATIALDAAAAFRAAGAEDDARRAARHGLKLLTGDATDGLRLELLLALAACGPDARVKAATAAVAERIAGGLPAQVAGVFRSRPDIAAVLG